MASRLMLVVTLQSDEHAGRSCALSKGIPDGQDTQVTGSRESNRAVENDDLAASAEWGFPRAG